MEAAVVLPQAGRVAARGRRPGVSGGATQRVGVLDASTLGKIDIQGPDANVFLNRVYTNPFLKVPVGRCRYGLMLDENGMLMDDGVTARLGETPLLDAHHYGRRRPRHVLAGALAPDRMARVAGST